MFFEQAKQGGVLVLWIKILKKKVENNLENKKKYLPLHPVNGKDADVAQLARARDL